MRRQQIYKTEEGRAYLEKKEGNTHHAKGCQCCNHHNEQIEKGRRVPGKRARSKSKSNKFCRSNFWLHSEEAQMEASRCLNCKNPLCMKGCPVSIEIFLPLLKK